jgi:uncharacterized membrane protein YkgB
MTAKHFLAAFLGALAIFFSSFVFHMFTPLGEAGISPLPGPDAVSSALTSAIGDKPGMYMFPTGGLTADSPRQEHAAAMEKIMEEVKTKPSGLLVYKPAGATFNFAQSLVTEFGIDLLEALLVVYLLSQTVLATFGGRVLFVTVAGLLAAIATQPSLWNWYGFNGTYTLANIVMEVIGFLCAGLVIALVTKNTPANQRA